MTELILTRGIPASGKTTWARAWVAENPTGRARVNRDDLRQNLYGQPAPLPYELEQVITVAQHGAVRRLLGGKIDVVVDDTNLHMKYVREYAKIAAEAGATIRLEDFDTSFEECVHRDARRTSGHVGLDVIHRMHQRWKSAKQHGLEDLEATEDPYVYVPDETLPPAWIFDIDGTLSLNLGGRSPFDWGRVGEDDCNRPVFELAQSLSFGHVRREVEFPRPYIIVLSGRDEVCRTETWTWLREHGLDFRDLFMRPAGDTRKDAIVKLELFREYVAPRYHVVGVVDDRQQVVDMWRRIGLFCAQVAPGDF